MIDQCNFTEYSNHHGSMVDIDFEFHAKDVPAGIAESVLEAIEEFKFRTTAPDTESPKSERPVPDPDPDTDPCMKCDKDIRDFAECDKCSPPPAPIAASLKKKFNPPASEKKPAKKPKSAIVKMVKKESNAKNAQPPRWTDDEKAIVSKAPDADTAWTEYHKAFPKSERNENAIYQRWLRNHDQAPLKVKTPAKAPKKAAVKKERLPFKMKNRQQPETPPLEEPVTHYPDDMAAMEEGQFEASLQHNDQPETYTVKGLDQDLADALPDERPPSGHKEKREAALTMETIKIGDQVRQIGGLKICAGIGTVKRAPSGNPEVLVGFGSGQEWINRKNLAPVGAA